MKKTLLCTLATFCIAAPITQAIAVENDNSLEFKYLALPKSLQQVHSSNEPVSLPSFVAETTAEGTPASLNKALQAAYETNPELIAQRNGLEALNERVPQAMSASLPQIDLNYEDGRQRTRSGGTSWNYTDTKQRTATVVQPIFRGGQTWFNTSAARNEVKAARERLTQTEQGILLNTLTGYMEVLRTEAVLALSKKNLSVLREQLKASQQRFNVGEDTKTDTAQAESRVALAHSRVSESESNVAAAKAAFKRLTGYLPQDLQVPGLPAAMPQTIDDVVKLAKEHNPTVMEQEFLQEAADDAIYARAGSLLPTVGIRGQMSRTEGGGIFGTTDFDEDSVVMTVNIPVFQGGNRYSTVRQAKETYHQRRFQLLDSRNRAEEQAIASWEAYLAARDTKVSNAAAIKAADIALEGVKQEQKYGARTTLDVLDAEQELFNAQVNYVTSQRDYIVAAYQVMTVIGKMTAEGLNLKTEHYNAEESLDDVEFQFIGF